jgi:hypothetical protein
LRGVDGERLAEIVRLPQFTQVRELTAHTRRLEAGRFAHSPGLTGLTALSLNGLDQGREFVAALAA